MQGARRQSRYPRGQVITMMIAAIVTVTAALGGFIVLLLGHR
jgi:cytochrome P450